MMNVSFTAQWLTEGVVPAADGGWLATGTDTDTGDLVTVRMGDELQPMIEAVYDGQREDQAAEVDPGQVTDRYPLRMIAVQVNGTSPTREQVASYLPAGYQVTGGCPGLDWIVAGHDLNNFTAEWTADRLRSGMIGCRILGEYVPGEVH